MWKNTKILHVQELRPRFTDSRKQLKGWLDKIWQMIGPAVSRNAFVPWNLSQARSRMVEDREKNAKMYRCSHSRVKDGNQNVATFECRMAQGNLFDYQDLAESIARFLDSDDGECLQLRVSGQ